LLLFVLSFDDVMTTLPSNRPAFDVDRVMSMDVVAFGASDV